MAGWCPEQVTIPAESMIVNWKRRSRIHKEISDSIHKEHRLHAVLAWNICFDSALTACLAAIVEEELIVLYIQSKCR